MTTRTVHHLIKSMPASDGAGVKLRRSLGQSQFARLDPFLMLENSPRTTRRTTSPAFPRTRIAASRR